MKPMRGRGGALLLLALALLTTGCIGEEDVSLDQLTHEGLAVTITPEEGSVDETFTFDATGTPGADALTFTWDFGDGTTAKGAIVEHTFAWDNHTYTVQVTASDGTDSVTGNLNVPVGTGENTPPTITVTADAAWISQEDPLTVTADVTDPDGDPVEIEWLIAQRIEASNEEDSVYDLPEETDKTGDDATFTFDESGTYKIIGKATDAKGDSSTDEIEVKVTRTVPRTTFTLVEEGTLAAGTGAGATGQSISEILYDLQEPSQNTFIDAARYDTTLLYPGKGTLSLDWSNATTPADLELILETRDGTPVETLTADDPTQHRLETSIDLDRGSYVLTVRANAAANTDYTLTLDLDLIIPGLTDQQSPSEPQHENDEDEDPYD